ncbi:MAG TPA: hypothetical protein VMW47_13475 [Verrucomicrobiae bacterium]|nr:hypothetical protein [Verrucomicrobiae bacterium]
MTAGRSRAERLAIAGGRVAHVARLLRDHGTESGHPPGTVADCPICVRLDREATNALRAQDRAIRSRT